MTVENWPALLLLLFLTFLTLLVSSYVVVSFRQWRRAVARDPEADSPRPRVRGRENHIQIQPPPIEPEADDPRASWDTLTRREKQVARLAAQKLTDAEIADQLGISEKTVGNHLYSIYSKLEINSRHELKFILRQLGPDP